MKRKRNGDIIEKKLSLPRKKQLLPRLLLTVNDDDKLPNDIIRQIIINTIPFPNNWKVPDESEAVQEILAKPTEHVNLTASHHKNFCKRYNQLLITKQWCVELRKLKKIYRKARYSFEISLPSSISIDENGNKLCHETVEFRCFVYSTMKEVVEARLKLRQKNESVFAYTDWWKHMLIREKIWRF